MLILSYERAMEIMHLGASLFKTVLFTMKFMLIQSKPVCAMLEDAYTVQSACTCHRNVTNIHDLSRTSEDFFFYFLSNSDNTLTFSSYLNKAS